MQDNHGNWIKATIAQSVQLDSAVRETMRHGPLYDHVRVKKIYLDCTVMLVYTRRNNNVQKVERRLCLK